MESLSHRQKIFVDQFLIHSTRLLQNGFAYLFSNPEMMFELRCELEKIRKMEENLPKAKCHYQRLIKEAYIDYIIKLSRLGFRYVKSNPEAYGEIATLQNLFVEYEKLRSDSIAVQRQEKNVETQRRQEKVTREKCLHDTMKEVGDKVKVIHERREREKRLEACRVKASQEVLEKFNEYLKRKLRAIDLEKLRRQKAREQQKTKIEVESDEDSDADSSETMLSFDDFEAPLKETAKIGKIQRNIFIPIKSKEPTIITTRSSLQRSSGDGDMCLAIELNVEGGVEHQGKLAKGIRIESAMPAQTIHNRSARK